MLYAFTITYLLGFWHKFVYFYWSKVVNKAKTDIMSDWDRDIHIDDLMESSLLISLTDDESSENSDVPDSDMSIDE